MIVPPILLSMLVYPGLLLALLLALGVGRVLGGPATGGRAFDGFRDALAGRGPLGSAASAVLALIALTQLSWPAAPWQTAGAPRPWLLWALVEGSSITALLPGLASALPSVSRAAVREAQLGLSGRLPAWIGLAVALQARANYGAENLPALVLALSAALLALPAAAGWPPFGALIPGQGASFGSGETWLDDRAAALARWARRLRSIFWLAFVATVLAPLPPLPWWTQLLMRFALVIALAAIMRGLQGSLVNRTLPAALRWCWWLALPLAILAVALQP